MATNSHSGGNGPYTLEVQIDLVSQSIEGNYSIVRRQARLIVRSYYFSGSNVTAYGYANGSQIWSNTGKMTTATHTTFTLYDQTSTIYHNADGTASDANTRATFKTNTQGQSWSVPQLDTTVSISLPTIPRATTPTWSGNFVAGTEKTITLNRAAPAFTHDVTYQFGSESGSIGTGLGTSVAWTPPMALLNQMTEASSAAGTITTVTKSGSTTIGTKVTPFTLEAGPEIVPTVSAVVWDDTNTTVKTNIGAFVQGASRPNGTVTAAGIYGSTIVSRWLTVGGSQVPHNTAFTVNTAGTITASGSAQDTRSRVGTKAQNFSVLAYTPPLVNALSVFRSNGSKVPLDTGQYLTMDLNAVVSSLIVSSVQKNQMTVVISTRPTASSGSFTQRNSFTSALSHNATVLIGGGEIYLQTVSYDVQIDITDKTGTSVSFTVTIPVAVVTADFAGNNVGIAKLWEQGALDVGGDTYIRGDVFADGDVSADTFWSDGLIVAGAALRGDTAKMTALKTNSLAYDDMEFFNTDDNKLYTFYSGVWYPPLPTPVTQWQKNLSYTITTAANVWGTHANSTTITLDLPHALDVLVDFFGVVTAGTSTYGMLGIEVSGATTLAPMAHNGLEADGNASWYGAHTPYSNFLASHSEVTGQKLIRLNAGENVLKIATRRNNTTVAPTIDYAQMTITPISWANLTGTGIGGGGAGGGGGGGGGGGSTSDTGWLPVTPPATATASDMQYRVINGVALLRGKLVLNTPVAAGAQIGVTGGWVPAALRPEPGFEAPLVGVGAGNAAVNIVVTSGGDLWLRNNSGTSVSSVALAAPGGGGGAVQDTGWVQIDGWSSGWSHSARPVKYRKIGNYVELRGALLNSTFTGSLTTIGMLPEAIRPPQNLIVQLPINGTAIRAAALNATGELQVYGSSASTSWWNFDSIGYLLDEPGSGPSGTITGGTDLVGSVALWAGATAPMGYLLCDGSAISRSGYPELFEIIGDTYGPGDGSTTFNLPDMRGRVPVGVSPTDTEFDTLGEKYGAKTHTLTVAEIPAHSHGTNGGWGAGSLGVGTFRVDGNNPSTYWTNSKDAGGGGAHNNIQPSIALNYIIKYAEPDGDGGVNDSGWIAAPLANSHTSEPGRPAMYRRIDKSVELTGQVNKAAIATGVVFTLPEGFRPTQPKAYVVASAGVNVAKIDVQANGEVRVAGIPTSPTLTYVMLDGIRFSI